MPTNLKSTIVSIVPFVIKEYKPGLYPPHYIIPASSDGDKDIQIVHVGEATHYMYIDQDRGHARLFTPPYEVARSVVEDFVSGQLGVDENAAPGLFWLPREESLESVKSEHKEKLELARTRQRNWFKNATMIADNDWNRFHQHNVISDFQRRMAVLIGLDPVKHEWMSPEVAASKVKCPGCYSMVDPQQAFCAICLTVINPEKAKGIQRMDKRQLVNA